MKPTEEDVNAYRGRGSYREAVYARYVEIQVPGWLHFSEASKLVERRGLVSRLQGWLPACSSARCLDLGCGAGDQMVALRSMGYHNLIGVDRGPQQIALAEKRGLRVVKADLRDYLRGCDQAFDAIFAFDIIEHFAKDEVLELLGLIWDGLKPGGILVLQTPNALSPWAAHYRYADLTHELIFSPECMASTLRLTGFGEIGISEVGPFIHGIRSAGRWALWQLIRAGCALWNLAETGSANGGVYSRNMLVRAVKDRAL
jgi:2-polyprenyl-3-methyl-5-hydroxy-6-metoxy-1,4-benzoquinol methylase